MTSDQNNSTGRDPQLWDLAKRRASFKGHFAVYLVMSAFFWILWYFSGGGKNGNSLPWPVWPMFGWGLGVAFHFIGAYINPLNNAVEKEYNKLVEKQSI